MSERKKVVFAFHIFCLGIVAAANSGEENCRRGGEPRELFTLRHDLCQLSQAARLYKFGGYFFLTKKNSFLSENKFFVFFSRMVTDSLDLIFVK